MTIGEKIRKYRLQKGLSQKELAKRCGFSKAAISNYEVGIRTPKSEQLSNIANALKISVYAISNPCLDDIPGIMHILFYLEKNYGLRISREEDRIALYLSEKNELFPVLHDWGKVKDKYELECISEESYEKWKDQYPLMSTDKIS